MKILMLVNWKIQYCQQRPSDKQPPDYCVAGEDYWFYRYFREKPQVDVVDVSSFPWLERFEKNKLRFYVWQTLKVLPKLGRYDLIVSHGMQSGVVLSLFRRLLKTKAKHIVFDIGSFGSAAERGMALKLMQFASRSIDGLIYHTGSQIDYYRGFFPWLVEKSRFIRFGTDLEFFSPSGGEEKQQAAPYLICVGYAKRDWDTLVKAYRMVDTNVKLRLVGHIDPQYANIPGVEQVDFVPIRELMAQISHAWAAVLPLEQFNYSYGQMTLMQQMALGKCVIAARVSSLVDYIDDDTAVLYTPGDARDLADQLEKVLADPGFRDTIARNGQNHLRKNCNEAVMARQIEDFFHEIRKE